ncbi:monosaccharide ABC transporter substrate-binding protein, CUT2 family [Pasteurella multocida]|uniref:autoinducer 2 ABC transporter substrate-binding protein n=3 Tax=Pasteurellaceae TaxID=712 RepID=UPI000282954D|nr:MULTISPECIES: autoinducer 2 ABC transporter substrate-binding protein [Pasteurella]AMM82400.2 LacI family transcriptional regulator [Pasteurella multocida subsp. multocida PMTB2.1]APW57102.1 autoinducer 2 ABC transporter substrate-binding protein [Pasteurella multocida]ARB73931.1 autoinducer 2 ABC transporter substrate-binding protein [Pasteurella multocida]ATC20734.1 autoinducer 2 ABC transporter substrate-binding protein [Pasteurella multocida]AXQ72896.1 LacI family transcriptional regula
MKTQIFRRLLLSTILALSCSSVVLATNIVNISKIDGMPWFNRMGEGVVQAGKDNNVNAYQVGPSNTDAPQQVKLIEDLIAKKVDAISIVPNDANALEPVLKKAKQNGILILTNESVGQPSADWDIEIIDNAQFAADYVEEVAKAINGKGGYVIYVGGLTVPQHNLWSDLFIQYQKKHYPDMYEVTSRMPVAENIDDARRTTIDLIKAHPDLKAVISFGSQGPIGAGLAVKEKRLKGKLNVFGMMIPSQAASLIKSGNITMGITYDPASAGYALVTVAAKLLKGEKIEDGIEIPTVGKAKVNTEKKLLQFHDVLRVTKENIDSLY